jgi:hypothetical protein
MFDKDKAEKLTDMYAGFDLGTWLENQGTNLHIVLLLQAYIFPYMAYTKIRNLNPSFP